MQSDRRDEVNSRFLQFLRTCRKSNALWGKKLKGLTTSGSTQCCRGVTSLKNCAATPAHSNCESVGAEASGAEVRSPAYVEYFLHSASNDSETKTWGQWLGRNLLSDKD